VRCLYLGLINKTVLMRWNSNNKKYYESKGYVYTKMKDEFEVKVEDLPNSSNIKVDVKCDGCGEILKPIKWQDYKKGVKEDDKYYCHKCAKNNYKKWISFEEWCINNRQDILDRWDYDLNKLKPNEITYGTEKKYYFKCPRGIHESELKNISSFTSGQEGSMYCNQCSSFKQWCLDNNRQDVLDRWDYKLNKSKPHEIAYATDKKQYFKCPRGIHKSELKRISDFVCGCEGSIKCKKCGSFAQYLIDTYGENALELYWNYEKNTVDPWKIDKSSNKFKVWIKCQEKDYHDSYPIYCNAFIQGNRCSYCKRTYKIHPLDSLGKLLEDKGLLHLWSDKNEKSPYEYAPYAHKEVYWKCPEGLHEDYPRNIYNSNIYNFRCPECGYSKGEDRISSNLTNKGFIKISQEEFDQLINQDKYNNNYYIPQMKYEGLVGLGNGLLSYDFCIPKYNLLIEYDGEFHYKPIKKYKNEPIKYAEERFKKQQEHDRRKNMYCQINNIPLLRIPYWEVQNIEQILTDYLHKLRL